MALTDTNRSKFAHCEYENDRESYDYSYINALQVR